MIDQMQLLQTYLEQSEKCNFQDSLTQTKNHFTKLVIHAHSTVPFYQRFYKNIDIIADTLPIVTRELIQSAGDDFISGEIPTSHGASYPLETSGSTGKAIKILATDFTRLFYDALMLREHIWHKRDLTKTLMAIRWERRGIAHAPIGHYQTTWGSPINQYKKTGSSIFINVASDTPSQIEALLIYKPQYLNTYPSQLAALAEFCLEHKIHLPFLEEVRTTGETFHENYKKVIQQAWPWIKITDVYSSVEIGHIAHQCLEFGNYHVNLENVFLEIIDEKGQPCELHQPGRVLVTSLLNYATPLIRYEIGDYAAWGDICGCGRTLPVINKILGRKRNRLRFPNGESRFPYLGEREDRKKITDVVKKFQFVQHTVHDIEYKVVVTSLLSTEQEEQLKKLHQTNLGYPFNISISYHENIPTGPSGKYEEFVSCVE